MDVAGVLGCNGLRMQALRNAAEGIVLLGCQEGRHADDSIKYLTIKLAAYGELSHEVMHLHTDYTVKSH